MKELPAKWSLGLIGWKLKMLLQTGTAVLIQMDMTNMGIRGTIP